MDAERSLHHLSESSYHARLKRPSPLPRLSSWLLVAVGLCWLLWPAPAEAQPACDHGICDTGTNLNSVCDPCVDDICAADPYCCAVEWDDNCVDEVLLICGDVSCAAACSHNPCEIGEALDSTCSSCTATVCFNNPNCCTDDGDPLTDDWDASCVADVVDECVAQCEPGANICSNALPINRGKLFGTLLGSSNDGCESSQSSCRSGDVWYSYTQPLNTPSDDIDMELFTCATQRSFGIDSVLSVHTGCPGKRNNEIIANDDWMLGQLPQACFGTASPNNLDSALPLGGVYALDPGETVVIRIAHHDDSVRGNFELRVLPEPEVWLALVAGAGALGALSRRRARG